MREYTYSFQRAQYWMIAGFFFSFFQLKNSYLGYITSLIAVICLSAGLRILSKEHKAYAKAYHISLVQLVCSTIIYILMATPWKIQGCLPWIQIICMIILLYEYTCGMKEMLGSHQEETIRFIRPIFWEYVCYALLFVWAMMSDRNIIVWIALVLSIVILIQISLTHRKLNQVLPETRITISGPPVAVSAVGILVGVLTLIIAITYQVSRSDSLNYALWHSQDTIEQEQLLQKGLPKEIVQDLSQDTIEKMQKVKSFHACVDVQADFQVESYAGLDTDGTLHYLGYVDFDAMGIQGRSALLPQLLGSVNQRSGSIEEIAVLYDQKEQSYGYVQQMPYEFRFTKGTHHRGYVYMSAHDASDSIFEAGIKFQYQSSWFQYPYQKLDLGYMQIEHTFNNQTRKKQYISTIETRSIEE